MSRLSKENRDACRDCPLRRGDLCTVSGHPTRFHALQWRCPPEGTAPAPPPSRGLGDTVAKVLDRTGIGPVASRVIERVTGKPCNCSGRQARLNALVPYSPPTLNPWSTRAITSRIGAAMPIVA